MPTWIRRTLLGFGAVVSLLLGFALYIATTSGLRAPQGPESRRYFERGPHAVGRQNLLLVDDTRPTAANRSFPGGPVRTLPTTVWFPQDAAERVARDGAPFPLVVYSHGFMSYRGEGAYLCEHLASHGYVVLATDYPLAHYGAPGGPNTADAANQPADVSFLIDSALAWSDEPGHEFEGAVDAARIGLAGVSLGGLTSTLTAFHPRLRDSRIAAAVSIAGPSMLFDGRFFASARVPFLMVAGDVDAFMSYEQNAAQLQQVAPDALLVTLHGASHAGFADVARYLMRWHRNPDSVGCGAVRGRLDDESTLGDIGDASEGIIVDRQVVWPCSEPELPPAMRPAWQQTLTLLSVFAFFESRFAETQTDRRAARAFLAQGLARENAEVDVSLPAAGRGRSAGAS